MTHKVTNNAGRRIGLPIRQAFTLDPGETREVTDGQLSEMESNKTTSRWMDSGVLTVDSEQPRPPKKAKASPGDDPPPEALTKPEKGGKTQTKAEEEPAEELPEGITGEGIEYEQYPGGWYHLWVNGFRVTQDNKVRKAEAEHMAKEYR